VGNVVNEEFGAFKNILARHGYKFTRERRLVLSIVLESKIHLSVKEIYKKIKSKNIGLATVYRTLKLFHQLGIVKELNIDGVSFYEMKIFSGNPLHIHFKCENCNNIFDVYSENINFDYIKLNSKIEAENDIEIKDADIMFTGLCSKCRGELKCQGPQKLEE
jgi:Fe2+ or Zn2+ uptake regulation protein